MKNIYILYIVHDWKLVSIIHTMFYVKCEVSCIVLCFCFPFVNPAVNWMIGAATVVQKQAEGKYDVYTVLTQQDVEIKNTHGHRGFTVLRQYRVLNMSSGICQSHFLNARPVTGCQVNA